MVGPWPLAPHHDHLQFIHHHIHLMQRGQNRDIIVMEMIKWSQQGTTILNLRGMYNVRSTLVLGGNNTSQKSSF